MNKFFARISSRKFLAVVIVVFLALAAFGMLSGVAFASPTATTPIPKAATQSPEPWSCSLTSGDLATCLVGFISYVISEFLGVLIAIAAWIITVGLQLSTNIYNSPFVQSGFGVCLSIANLGFVLAMIVIAIATILKRDTYGYKNMLWRLVVMAILVNFGLVITAPLVNFANQITTYFMTSIDGGTQGTAVFANQLALTTSPAAADQAPVNSATNDPCATERQAAEGVSSPQAKEALLMCLDAQKSSPSGNIMKAIMALIFAVVFKSIIVLAFLSIGALLFVRYIYLGVLLTLLPFAWLLWIFPKFSHEFEKWWGNFIKWAFFSPAAMFFIWLALLIQRNGYLSQVSQTGTQQITNSPAMAVFLATGLINTLTPFMNNIIVLSIMLGGLMAASSMTGKAGAFVVGQAKLVSGSVGNFTAKQGKKASRFAYQKAGGHAFTTRLQEGRFGIFGGIPGVRRAASLAGRGLASIQVNKDLVEQAKKRVSDDPEEIRKNLRGSMNKEDQLAHIAKLIEKGEFKGDEVINGSGVVLAEDKIMRDGTIKRKGTVDGSGQKASDFMDANQASGLIERFGQGKLSKDADKALGSDKAMRDAARELNHVVEAQGDETEALARYTLASKEFIQKLSKSDVSSKMNVDGMIKPLKNEAGKIIGASPESMELLSVIAQHNPQLLAPMLTKAKGATGEAIREGLNQIYRDEEQGMGSWKSNNDFLARSTEIDARVQELKGRLDAVINDKKMNAAQIGEAKDKIQNELKDLDRESKPDEMQRRYVEDRLNQKYNKDKTDKAIASNVFGQAPFEQ